MYWLGLVKESSDYNWRSPSDATHVINEATGTAAWFGAEPDEGADCIIFAAGGIGDTGCGSTSPYALCECAFQSNFM